MDHDTLQKPKDQKDTSKPAATLSLNVYTETFNRSLLSEAELKNAQVGHSWITLKFHDTKVCTHIPWSSNPTRPLVEREGGTSMGFWPLLETPDAFTQRRESYHTTDEEREHGYTPGAGASQDPAHRGFAFDKSVPGRVEEPDRAHQKDIKIRKEYDLTYGQVDALLKYVNESRNKDYNLYRYNCTTFAVEAVKAAGQTAPSGAVLGVCYPNALYQERACKVFCVNSVVNG